MTCVVGRLRGALMTGVVGRVRGALTTGVLRYIGWNAECGVVRVVEIYIFSVLRVENLMRRVGFIRLEKLRLRTIQQVF